MKPPTGTGGAGASGPVWAWLNGRPALEASPPLKIFKAEDVRLVLPAGWSSLVFRVQANGDRPALRAWLEGDADRARD